MKRLFVVLTLLFVLGGCRQESDKYRVMVIPKGTTHSFWKSVHAGAQQAAEELPNVRVIWQGPTREEDTEQQISVVRNAIGKRVDGIVLAPNNSNALVKYVQEANEAKIPVVIFDSGLGEGAEIVSYVATNNYNGGVNAARRLAEVVGKDGKVILLRYVAGSESTEQREKGFLETMQKEFPEITILSSDQYSGGTIESSRAAAAQLLARFEGQVNGFFAVNESSSLGVMRALEEIDWGNKWGGDIKFVAFDAHEKLIKGLQSGRVSGIVLQDPVKMGYESVKAVVAHLEGKKLPPRIDTGEYVATPDNLQTPEFDRLLNPKTVD